MCEMSGVSKEICVKFLQNKRFSPEAKERELTIDECPKCNVNNMLEQTEIGYRTYCFSCESVYETKSREVIIVGEKYFLDIMLMFSKLLSSNQQINI
jgi:hypothetical protein